MTKLPLYQKSVIVGLILSDGHLGFANKHNYSARLGFSQSLAHSPYLFYVFSLLTHYCNNYPALSKSIRRVGSSPTYSLYFHSRSLPCFTELYSMFYVNKVKIIPHNIYDLLTPVALAHLIMGDGSSQGSGLVICTDSFSVQDVVRLMNVLIIRYRLDCTFRDSGGFNRIYIRGCSMSLLRSIVITYFHPSMYYKLGLLSNKPLLNSLSPAASCTTYGCGAKTINIKHSYDTQVNRLASSASAIAVEVLDLETKSITVYTSAKRAADALNLVARTVATRIKTLSLKPIYGRYVIKGINNKNTHHIKNPVFFYSKSGKELIFPSISAANRHFNCK